MKQSFKKFRDQVQSVFSPLANEWIIDKYQGLLSSSPEFRELCELLAYKEGATHNLSEPNGELLYTFQLNMASISQTLDKTTSQPLL